MNPFRELEAKVPEIEEKIGYQFSDAKLLILSFTHRSFVNENRQIAPEHNERLEFLGDSVLGLIIADYLYRKYPENPEGKLSEMRSNLVNATSCAHFFSMLEFSQYLLLGKGEAQSMKTSILADAFEAIIGAIYLDGGYKAAKEFFLRFFQEKLEEEAEVPTRNFKAELQDYVQKMYKETPQYKVIEEMGPDHAKKFRVEVSVLGKPVGVGVGASKKEAEQQAAANALRKNST